MTRDERAAFAQGVKEGFVRAAELSGYPSAKWNRRANDERRIAEEAEQNAGGCPEGRSLLEAHFGCTVEEQFGK